MYCKYCGAQIDPRAKFCSGCGRPVEEGAPMYGGQPAQGAPAYGWQPAPAVRHSDLDTAIKVFMLLGCILMSLAILPMCWCIPMTVVLFKNMREGRFIGIGFKVCTLLFVSLVAGILLLCRDEYIA